ncbi:hypothetical protein CDAR_166581 [Caerostris darwini]|uniref:Uncharacterized protein n=1 Tax=Caerostris darwini TaxID=1538125 RepID=A0AAV4NBT6_9ARAC|nr:hypothetical protein CDAR_166581 [Caerostris darwini]
MLKRYHTNLKSYDLDLIFDDVTYSVSNYSQNVNSTFYSEYLHQGYTTNYIKTRKTIGSRSVIFQEDGANIRFTLPEANRTKRITDSLTIDFLNHSNI